jgi:hypothetical protein
VVSYILDTHWRASDVVSGAGRPLRIIQLVYIQLVVCHHQGKKKRKYANGRVRESQGVWRKMEPRNCIYTASFGSSLPYLRNYICQRVPKSTH